MLERNSDVAEMKIDEELGNDRCTRTLDQSRHAVRGLITDVRGVISDDFEDLIRLAAKSVAAKNWERNGAKNTQNATANYLSLFRRWSVSLRRGRVHRGSVPALIAASFSPDSSKPPFAQTLLLKSTED